MSNEEKILICIICNSGQWPDYFCMDLIKLYEHTKSIYPNTKIQPVIRSSVAEMRNCACLFATGEIELKNVEDVERHDYLVQLDTDHKYNKEFIVDLMKHKKEIVTGCTSSRHPPLNQTQYKELTKEIRGDANIVNPSKDEELIKIEASGPVGMLIDVDVLDKLSYPYYKTKHLGHEEGRRIDSAMGEDIYFCTKLKEADVDIWLDPSITFPHQLTNVFVSRGQIGL